METNKDTVEFTKNEKTIDAALVTLRKTLETYENINSSYNVVTYSINEIYDKEIFFRVRVVLSSKNKTKEPTRVRTSI